MYQYTIRIGGITVSVYQRFPKIDTRFDDFILQKQNDHQKEESGQAMKNDLSMNHFKDQVHTIPYIYITDKQLESLKNGSVQMRENALIRRELLNLLLRHGKILLHGVAVVLDGKAYLFLARSGTGKSTHAIKWLEEFGERAYILNGDKPLVGFEEETGHTMFAYGTPWKGKEGYGTDGKAPVAGICFLERGLDNTIISLSHSQSISRLLQQTVVPTKQSELEPFIRLMDRMVREVPCYLLHCTISRESARVAYEGMKDYES